MSQPNLPKDSSRCCPPVPASILTASRCELTDVTLKVAEGEIPKDLQGHAFFIAPVGSVDSGGLPYPNGNSILNGDGMVYRLDFDKPAEVRVTSRIMKPPCYYADAATRAGSKYGKYEFHNLGISRLSFKLGLRNQLNTAFLPIKFPDDQQDRLLVTYDTGRPYEIDTETLEVVTPIGSNKEWRGEASINFPLMPVFSTAHPVFDAFEGQMFTVNYGRSTINFLETIPFLYALDELPEEVSELLHQLARFIEAQAFIQDILKTTNQIAREIFQLYGRLLEQLIHVEIQDFVYLIRWDGSENIERWKLVLADGSTVRIEQTIHQIGVTKDYVILMDTAFKVGFDQIINNPAPKNQRAERLIRDLIVRPILPDSTIYIVRRADLKEGQHPACSDLEREVVVQKLLIPLEAAHFLVNYENPNNQITLHVGHICAWDVSESLRTYDKSAYNPEKDLPSYLYGMEQNEMDISRMGRYVINGKTGEVLKSEVICDIETTWGPALYAYRDALPPKKPTAQLDNIYWCTFGLWKDLLTKFLFDVYKDYKYRLVPPEELLRLADQGIPGTLFRLNTSTESPISIADRYEFPRGHIVLSPQFIPREQGEESSTNGYIVCCVFAPKRNEIWIFDAKKLDKPLCKLYHSSLNFGLSIHTAWLPKIGRRTASYNVPVREDYAPLIKNKPALMQELFEQEIFPHFQNPDNHP